MSIIDHYGFVSTFLDLKVLLNYAQGCYDHENYCDCKRVCQRILANDNLTMAQINTTNLLMGKAVFRLYQEENKLFLAYKESFNEREVQKWKESLFLKVKLVIHCYYKSETSHDDDLAMYFDIAMMQCIQIKNELSRCLLCLKSGQKLKRSHIIPRSVLENFRKATHQYKGNRFIEIYSPFDSSQFVGKNFSDKTLTKFMLCEQCEALLNVGGEQPFYNNFFKKIYDPLNPDCLTVALKLPYEEWLYHFCLGYIFRGIAAFIGIPNVSNSVEFYTFFKFCRLYLLKKELEPHLLPKVHILISPTSPPPEYRDQWTRETLVGPAGFHFTYRQLSNGALNHYPKVNFFAATLGIINILVTFSPESEDFELPASSFIDPSGGELLIPAEHERSDYLPLGIKELYSSISHDQRKRAQKVMFKKDKFAPIPINEGTNTKNSLEINLRKNFKLAEAISIDKELFQQQAEKDGGLFLNCLPQHFSVNHHHREMKLPENYKHLLHYHIMDIEEYINVTIFIGVKYFPDKKSLEIFVIYYEYMPEQTLCFGCELSPRDYSVKRYISDIPLQDYPEAVAERIADSVTVLPIVVPLAVKKAGFANHHSLLYHYEFK